MIGAGVIGLEMGSVWRRLGSEVVVTEAMDDFLGAADRDVAKSAQMQFKKQGLDIRLSSKVAKVEAGDNGITVTYNDPKGEQTLLVDRLIVAVGRKSNTAGVLADDCGVQLDERGRVVIDGHLQTAVRACTPSVTAWLARCLHTKPRKRVCWLPNRS